MAEYCVTDIVWELDGENEELINLPKTTIVDAPDEDGIADALFNRFGWLVNSFSVYGNWTEKKRVVNPLPCIESAFSDVAPIDTTGGGGYVILGKVTADDGVTYPFFADLLHDDVCLLDVCPYDLPEDEQQDVFDFEWQLYHYVAEYAGDDVTEFMRSLCEYIIKHNDEVSKHSWSNYLVGDIKQLLEFYKTRTDKDNQKVSYEKLLDMFVNYVTNDAMAASSDYVQMALEGAGCDKETAKKLGLGWVFGEEE